VLELQASAGMYTHLNGPHSRVPLGAYKIGLIAQERAPHLTNDVLDDPCISEKEWAKQEGMVAFAGHPLVVEDRLVGVMAMFAREPLEEDSIEALASVANTIAQVIERKRIEDTLRASEASLAEAQRIAHLGSWETDLITGGMRWSEEMYRIFGFAPGEVTLSRELLEKGTHPQDREVVLEAIRDAIEKQEPFSIEHRVLWPNGEVRVVQAQGEVAFDPSGRPISIVGTSLDITERKQAEEKLHQSERKYRSVVENVKEVIFQTDAEGLWTFLNFAWVEVTGFSVEESIGKNFLNYIYPEDRQRNLNLFQPLIEGKKDYCRYEIRYLTKEGGFRWTEVWARLTLDEEGNIIGTSGTLNDITERKRAEEELREANRRLEDLAVLKADFTVIIAHELDTPLAVIRGYLDMLATGELEPAEQSRVLAKIQSETDVLNILISDVREAAMVERDDFAIHPRRVLVSSLLIDAAASAKMLFEEHLLTVKDDTYEQVWADPKRIGQVLINLLTNAAKYSPEGTTIELRATPSAGRVRIEVIDSGYGVHPDDIARIFDKVRSGP